MPKDDKPKPTEITPIRGTVMAGPAPTISPSEPVAAIADLQITFTGGSAGEPISANFDVFLNASIGVSDDTAQLIDEGSSPPLVVVATQSGNRYTFTGVSFAQPGPGATRVLRIANMRVNATTVPVLAGSPAPVVAFVAVSPPIALNNPQQIVAFVEPQQEQPRCPNEYPSYIPEQEIPIGSQTCARGVPARTIQRECPREVIVIPAHYGLPCVRATGFRCEPEEVAVMPKRYKIKCTFTVTGTGDAQQTVISCDRDGAGTDAPPRVITWKGVRC
jgi:hypothetical protein